LQISIGVLSASVDLGRAKKFEFLENQLSAVAVPEQLDIGGMMPSLALFVFQNVHFIILVI
jgi:hypothetical protein